MKLLLLLLLVLLVLLLVVAGVNLGKLMSDLALALGCRVPSYNYLPKSLTKCLVTNYS